MPDQKSKLIRKIILSYALTFIVISLADSLTMIVDGMVVSRGLGAKALAAIGLADPSYKIMTLFSGMLAIGLQSLCAQAMGSGDRENANRTFAAGMIATAVIALLLTAACMIFTGALCALFGAGGDPELYGHLYGYLRGWFTGIPGYVVFFVLSPLVTLDGNRKLVTAATFVQSAVNIGGDLLSVFVFDAGTFGVGLSTGMAFNLSAAVLILNFARRHSAFKPLGVRPDFGALPNTLRIGLSQLTEQCSRILAPLLINRTILAVGGNSAMSAISVKSSILGFSLIIAIGVANSVNLMTQILYSERDAESLRSTVKNGLGLMLALDTLFSALLFAFAGLVARLYFPADSRECLLSVEAVRCLALSLLLNGCNVIVIKYLQGARKMLHVHLMTAFHRMISLTVFTALLGNCFGTKGLFAAIPASEAAVLLGYVLVALLTNRKKGFWDSVLMIPDCFGCSSGNSRSFSIRTLEEAVTVSEQIEDFLKQHQVDERTSYFSGRCMEELATNVVEHGFTKDGKKHDCDIRVMIDPDGVVLRIRDNCPYFNIRERYDSLTKDDPDAGLGIRLAYAVAKDVTYINILKTNTLIIRM